MLEQVGPVEHTEIWNEITNSARIAKHHDVGALAHQFILLLVAPELTLRKNLDLDFPLASVGDACCEQQAGLIGWLVGRQDMGDAQTGHRLGLGIREVGGGYGHTGPSNQLATS